MAEDVFHEIVDEVKAEREEKERKEREVHEEPSKDAAEPPKAVEGTGSFVCDVCQERFLTIRGKNIHYARSHIDQSHKEKKPVVKIVEKTALDKDGAKPTEQVTPQVPPRDICFDILVAIGFDKARLAELRVRDFHVIYDETISGKLTHLEINFYERKAKEDGPDAKTANDFAGSP